MRNKFGELINKKNIILSAFVLVCVFLSYYASVSIQNDVVRETVIGVCFLFELLYILYILYQIIHMKKKH
ncbi:hypothetical protein B5G37_12630 [Pseudoflavonifractor sp. An85]|nr:hypothetical protein B5G37_12630 [Pseudoflavonifractor sp. An85]